MLLGIWAAVADWVATVESEKVKSDPPGELSIVYEVPAPFFLTTNWIVVVSSKWEKPIQSSGKDAGSENPVLAKPTQVLASDTSILAKLVSNARCLFCW